MSTRLSDVKLDALGNAVGLSCAGVALSVIPLTSLFGGTLIAQQVTTSDIAYIIDEVLDPGIDPTEPQGSEGRIVTTTPVLLQLPNGDARDIPAGETLLDVLGRSTADARALRETMLRFRGALKVGNEAHLRLQMQAAEGFHAALHADLKIQAACLCELAAYAAATPELAKVAIDGKEILTFRDKMVRERQFPKEEQFVLEQIGATPDDVEGMIQEVEKINPDRLVDVSATLPALIEGTSSRIRQIDAFPIIDAAAMRNAAKAAIKV